MSRIGRKPIVIPEKVKLAIAGSIVNVEGPMGKNVYHIPKGLAVKVENKEAKVSVDGLPPEEVGGRYGLARALLQNAVNGVHQGFKKELEIIGLGFRAQVSGNKITLNLGFAKPVEFFFPKEVKVAVDGKQTFVTITGADRYLVGEVAARIRRLKRPEPYKGTGIRYKGEHIVRKAGKAAAGAAGGAKK